MRELSTPNPNSSDFWERECASLESALARKEAELKIEVAHSAELRQQIASLLLRIEDLKQDSFSGKLP